MASFDEVIHNAHIREKQLYFKKFGEKSFKVNRRDKRRLHLICNRRETPSCKFSIRCSMTTQGSIRMHEMTQIHSCSLQLRSELYKKDTALLVSSTNFCHLSKSSDKYVSSVDINTQEIRHAESLINTSELAVGSSNSGSNSVSHDVDGDKNVDGDGDKDALSSYARLKSSSGGSKFEFVGNQHVLAASSATRSLTSHSYASTSTAALPLAHQNTAPIKDLSDCETVVIGCIHLLRSYCETMNLDFDEIITRSDNRRSMTSSEEYRAVEALGTYGKKLCDADKVDNSTHNGLSTFLATRREYTQDQSAAPEAHEGNSELIAMDTMGGPEGKSLTKLALVLFCI